jgi:hypothetical protein
VKRSRKSCEMDERFARFNAEDRAVAHLAKLPPPVAHAIALDVEWSLATKCAAEQSEMWRRRDPRNVVPITLEDFRRLVVALTTIPPGLQFDAATERHVIDLLADFSSDWAWWIAHKVTQWAEVYVRMKRPELGVTSSRP